MDALLELETKHAHTFESLGHASMKHLIHHAERRIEASANADTQASTIPFERMILDIQRFQISEMRNAHPIALLFFVSKLCRLLVRPLSSYSVESSTNGAIESIEKLGKEDWYWDIQVPNTNNYLAHGLIHHNSAKTLLLAHLMVTHALMFPRAHVGVGRRVHKDLKDTLIEVTRQHCDGQLAFDFNGTTGAFRFRNGSIIRPFSWADRHYKKFRSHEFTMFVIEELTENDDEEFYTEIYNRLGRRRDVPESVLVSATNPDDPEHWAYRRFFMSDSPRRHVYKSRTADNPFLPESYISSLKESMDPKLWLRMGEGEWIPIRTSMIYHQYDTDANRQRTKYQVNPADEIHWCWDFNIGDGKPLSTCFFQYDKDRRFHVYADVVVEGLRTEDMLEECMGRGLLDTDTTYVINGDATGKHRDTRSRHNDYEIIRNWLSNAKRSNGTPIKWRMAVPLSNPKVRERHNKVNAQLRNAKGERRLLVYDGAEKVHEGLMLTKLKEGAEYIEDDSKDYQHVTTALGYGIVRTLADLDRGPAFTTYRR